MQNGFSFHTEFAEQMKDEDDLLPILEVRVLDMNRKSNFQVRKLTEFPIVENMKDLRSALSKYMPDIEHVENCMVGYVLERNKKYCIETNAELEKAYGHFKAGYQMWLDPTPVKTSDVSKKLPAKDKVTGS